MLLGVLLLIGTGLIWAFVGGFMSYTARNNVSIVVLQCAQVLMTLTVTFIIFPNYPVVYRRIPGL